MFLTGLGWGGSGGAWVLERESCKGQQQPGTGRGGCGGRPKEADTQQAPELVERLSPCVITEHGVWVGYTEGDRDGRGWVMGEVA